MLIYLNEIKKIEKRIIQLNKFYSNRFIKKYVKYLNEKIDRLAYQVENELEVE